MKENYCPRWESYTRKRKQSLSLFPFLYSRSLTLNLQPRVKTALSHCQPVSQGDTPDSVTSPQTTQPPQHHRPNPLPQKGSAKIGRAHV